MLREECLEVPVGEALLMELVLLMDRITLLVCKFEREGLILLFVFFLLSFNTFFCYKSCCSFSNGSMSTFYDIVGLRVILLLSNVSH